jgi:hypothetical protein
MNPTKNNIPHDEGSIFDRLADGELSESERRALLASLDAEPEGWRRCAMAFLEAQTWRDSFGELTHTMRKPAELPTLGAPPPSPKKRKKPLGTMGTVMAMAASFLLALGLGGWMLHEPPPGRFGAPGANMLADNNGPREVTPHPGVSPAVGETMRQPQTAASAPWQMVRLQAPGLTGDDEPLQLPALPRDRLDEDFLKTVPNPLPEDVLRAFERTGHEVRMHRELVPVQLKDGRQLIVPIDQVDVQYDRHQAN